MLSSVSVLDRGLAVTATRSVREYFLRHLAEGSRCRRCDCPSPFPPTPSVATNTLTNPPPLSSPISSASNLNGAFRQATLAPPASTTGNSSTQVWVKPLATPAGALVRWLRHAISAIRVACTLSSRILPERTRPAHCRTRHLLGPIALTLLCAAATACLSARPPTYPAPAPLSCRWCDRNLSARRSLF